MKRTAFSPHEKVYVQRLETSQKHNMSVQHYHDSLEIYLQLAGKRYIFYDNVCYIMQRGTLAIFAPFVIHYAESREVDCYERYVLNIKAEALAAILSDEEIKLLMNKLKSGIVHLSEEQTAEMCILLENVEKHVDDTGFLADKLLYGAVLQVLVYTTKCTKGQSASDLEVSTISTQMMGALNYLNLHYREEISLDQIAETVNMSKFHFCRTFKATTGATALEYLNNVRLTKVHSLLLNTDMTIDEIAGETGFSAVPNLTRVFKKVYGVSPSKFRKDNK